LRASAGALQAERLPIVMRVIPATHRRTAIAGWVVYAISWITPDSDGSRIGAGAFVKTAHAGISMLISANVRWSLIGACMLFGWLANFSILLRLSTWSRVVWMLAPWLPFALTLLFVPVRPSMSGRAALLLYFYPWAIGIALIHLAHIADARKSSLTSSLR
jgi:hypothetical protein